MKQGVCNGGRRHALGRVAGITLVAGFGGSVSMALPVIAQAARAADALRVRDFYDKDRSFSALTESLAGERIEVTGFMAPPLKADSNFFVLTARPMTTCPFCSDAADWPDDIAAVYTKRRLQATAFNVDIVVRGRLELGEFVDTDTGFVSLLRLEDAVVERR